MKCKQTKAYVSVRTVYFYFTFPPSLVADEIIHRVLWYNVMLITQRRSYTERETSILFAPINMYNMQHNSRFWSEDNFKAYYDNRRPFNCATDTLFPFQLPVQFLGVWCVCGRKNLNVKWHERGKCNKTLDLHIFGYIHIRTQSKYKIL